MHSFQPSRTRILFEVLCAVGIAASCGGAWLQTGASALLAASAIATLYGLVHFFDLFRSAPAVAVEPQRIEFAADGHADLLPVGQAAEPEEMTLEPAVTIEPTPLAANVVDLAEIVDPPAQKSGGARKGKPSRKGGSGRASSAKKAEPVEAVLAEEPEVPGPVTVEDAPHVHVAPLFEPEPFVRMPRQAFGRRGQI